MTNAIAQRISAICEKGNLKHKDIAMLLNTNPETVSRWNQGRNSPQPNAEQTLLILEFIIDQLSSLYAPNEARLWVFSPQKMLGGDSPAELIKEGDIKKVRSFVNQLVDSIYI